MGDLGYSLDKVKHDERKHRRHPTLQNGRRTLRRRWLRCRPPSIGPLSTNPSSSAPGCFHMAGIGTFPEQHTKRRIASYAHQGRFNRMRSLLRQWIRNCHRLLQDCSLDITGLNGNAAAEKDLSTFTFELYSYHNLPPPLVN